MADWLGEGERLRTTQNSIASSFSLPASCLDDRGIAIRRDLYGVGREQASHILELPVELLLHLRVGGITCLGLG